KISGPLLDRIAIHLQVRAVPSRELNGPGRCSVPTSAAIRKTVWQAIDIQRERYAESHGIKRNAEVPFNLLERFCRMDKEAETFLSSAQRKLLFSARTRKNIILVSRTIADLDQSGDIKKIHIMEAVQYRPPARK
ncbi:MAG: hypothetical protein JXB45_00005, partial [Candidatus Krumholzibacteriota bacterium]|nr:hypothetical protein [Candidatus Krumholzibacteriota bacterium]